jgi:hypothetical protein
MPAVGAASASGSTAQEFWSQVLTDMGAPVTTSNIQALSAWSEREGGGGAYNPLNTTRPEPGSTGLKGNPDGVQNYTSITQGAQATADSIRNGRYPSILAAFMTGSAFEALVGGGKGPIGAQLRVWSGGGYNNVNAGSGSYVAPNLGGGLRSPGTGGVTATASTAAASPSTTGCQTLAEQIAAQGNVPIVGGLPGEAQIAGFFAWITQGCVQKRILFQGIGAFMIFYGFKMLGHSEPLKIVSAPFRAAGGAAKGAGGAAKDAIGAGML